MKTVGEILSTARVSRQLSLEEISRDTRINLKYLQAIEANDFDQLPPSAFTKGFLQNFAHAVSADPKQVLAIFRRDYDADAKGRIIPRTLTETSRRSLFTFNPSSATLIIAGILGALVVAFFLRQIIDFRSAPDLQVSEPQDQAQLTSPITVKGNTHPQATVHINNRLATVTENGDFSQEITLTPGEHTLVITSSGRSGQKRTLLRQITIIPLTSD